MGSRLLRAVEKWLTPWYRRDVAERRVRAAVVAVAREERKAVETEARRRNAIAARIEAEEVRRAYAAAGNRLTRPTQ